MAVSRLAPAQLEPERQRRAHAHQHADRALMETLLEIEQRDVATLTPTDWESLRRTFERFDGYRDSGAFHPSMFTDGKAAKLRALSQREMRVNIGVLRDMLDALRPRHPERSAEMPYPGVPVRGTVERRLGTSDITGGRIYRVAVAPWPETFWLAVERLLVAFGDRLRRCPAPLGAEACGKLFIKAGRAEYCSSKCRDRARSRKWYHEHLEHARKRRRRAHVKKVRQTTGPHVKVGRRGKADGEAI